MRRLFVAILSLPLVTWSCATDSGQNVAADTSTTAGTEVQQHIDVVSGRQMALVPAASFAMGCDVAEYAARADRGCDDLGSASPVHTVQVPAFRIDVTEVTQSAYRAYLQATGANEPAGCDGWDPNARGEYPFSCADWGQADAFCRWAGSRLCSEAEWELAARGSQGLRHPWGNEPPTCARANLWECTGQPGATMAVGAHPTGASPCGAQDMLGNVSEWVEDDYHAGFAGAPVDGSAWVDSPRSAVSVLKGGNFSSDEWTDASSRASLEHLPPDASMSWGPGIRCCRDAVGP